MYGVYSHGEAEHLFSIPPIMAVDAVHVHVKQHNSRFLFSPIDGLEELDVLQLRLGKVVAACCAGISYYR